MDKKNTIKGAVTLIEQINGYVFLRMRVYSNEEYRFLADKLHLGTITISQDGEEA